MVLKLFAKNHKQIYLQKKKNKNCHKTKGKRNYSWYSMELLEIKQELKNSNTVKTEKIYRLQKFNKVKQEKIDTESVIIENNQDIEFPFQKYEHVSHI